MYSWCTFSTVLLHLDCSPQKTSLLGFFKIYFSCITGVVLVLFSCILIAPNIIAYWDFFLLYMHIQIAELAFTFASNKREQSYKSLIKVK